MSTEWTTFLLVLAHSAATLLALLAWQHSTAPCVANPKAERHT
jgi:hypothetical protein